jgi:hypothetical protein
MAGDEARRPWERTSEQLMVRSAQTARLDAEHGVVVGGDRDRQQTTHQAAGSFEDQRGRLR